MKVLIFGAGGVGSVVGGFLARSGHEVSLLGRPWHIDAIRKSGLFITGIWGDYRIKAFDLYANLDELHPCESDFDLIILTVKSYDTRQAIVELLPFMKEKTMLLLLQNGLGNVETALEKVRAEQLLIGRVIFGVETSPGVAKVTVNADDVVIGPAPGASPKLAAGRLAMTFSTAKIPTRSTDDIFPVIWSKVIYNCALNGICTLHEMPYGKILENVETKAQMQAIVRECYAVGLAKGIHLQPPSAEAYIDLLTQTLIPRTAAHFPSMLQDLNKGKRTDIEALNGAICVFGRTFRIPTPANEEIYLSILKKSAILN